MLFYHDDPFLTKILIFKIRGDFLKIVVQLFNQDKDQRRLFNIARAFFDPGDFLTLNGFFANHIF